MQAAADTAAALWDELDAFVDTLEPSDWAKPTPCSRWNVHDVVAHMAGLQTAMDQSAPQPSLPEGWKPDAELNALDSFTEAGVVARREWTVEQLRDEIAHAKKGQVARWLAAEPDEEALGPLGMTTMDKLHGVRMFDLWVHLQDLRIAVGQAIDLHTDSPAGQDGGRYIFRNIPVLAAKRAGLRDGQRLSVNVQAPLAISGVIEVNEGRAAWSDNKTASDDHVEAQPGALLMLLAGRGSPESWRAQQGLSWGGDMGEAFVRLARVFTA